MEQGPIAYILELTEKKEIAYQTMEFRFKKPEGFEYRAGQSMRIKIPGGDEERTLSIVTAPHEPDLAFAFRIRGSQFKKRLKRFEIGETVIASGPYGTFGLHDDESQSALYIAGGIGITIFVSILSYLAHKNKKHPIILLYSNRNEEDISYLTTLKAIESDNPNVHIVPILTKEKPEKWQEQTGGELGRIDKRMISKYVPDIKNTFFYAAGAPEMVECIEAMLSAMGVPKDNLHMKRFRGY